MIMKIMKNNIKWMALASLVMFSCSTESDVVTAPSTDTTTATPGTANFTKYVALGDSFAAGYSDGALFKAAQETAYPNILAQQFAAAGGGVFKTPFASDNIGGLLYGGNIIKTPRLYFNGAAPVSVAGTPTTETTTVLTGGFNNMGVPGAKSFHLLAPGYGSVAGVLAGTANPFFARFASSATTTVLADAVAQAPTFFSLWIGGNDELGYALAGGVTKAQDNINGDDLTLPAAFDGYYNALITGLTANNAKGVVANLPYVSTLPYFTTVPYNPVALDAAKATALNSGYASYNGGLQAMVGAGVITADEATKRTINFTASATNPVVIVDEYLTNLSTFGIPSYRHATSEDLLVLTSSTFIGTTVGGDPTKINGVSVPLADKWVLSKNELAEIKAATDAFNITIKAAADAKGLAFVDAKAIMAQLVSPYGYSANGFTLKSTFVTGGAFSLDGVHPSPRGYALIANEFIKAINAKYGSTLKAVDLSKYRVLFPATL
jgi:lysophospholipase L1-like esterase